ACAPGHDASRRHAARPLARRGRAEVTVRRCPTRVPVTPGYSASTAAAGGATTLADVARTGRAHLGPAGHADRSVGLPALDLFHQLGGRVHVRRSGAGRSEGLRRSGLGLRRTVTVFARLSERRVW